MMEDLGLFTFSFILTLNIACATDINVCDKKGDMRQSLHNFVQQVEPYIKMC